MIDPAQAAAEHFYSGALSRIARIMVGLAPLLVAGAWLKFGVRPAIGFAFGEPVVGIAFAALALVAAFLNAAFDLCLGCQMYLFIQRIRPAQQGGPNKEVSQP